MTFGKTDPGEHGRDRALQVGEGRELRSGAATQNGHEAVVGTVVMLVGANSREVARAAAKKLQEANASLPAGVTATAVYDRIVDRFCKNAKKTFGK